MSSTMAPLSWGVRLALVLLGDTDPWAELLLLSVGVRADMIDQRGGGVENINGAW